MIALSEKQVIAKGTNAKGRELVVYRRISQSVLDELVAAGTDNIDDWLKRVTVEFMTSTNVFMGAVGEDAEDLLFLLNYARHNSERNVTLIGSWGEAVGSDQSFAIDLLDVDEVEAYLEQQGFDQHGFNP